MSSLESCQHMRNLPAKHKSKVSFFSFHNLTPPYRCLTNHPLGVLCTRLTWGQSRYSTLSSCVFCCGFHYFCCYAVLSTFSLLPLLQYHSCSPSPHLPSFSAQSSDTLLCPPGPPQCLPPIPRMLPGGMKGCCAVAKAPGLLCHLCSKLLTPQPAASGHSAVLWSAIPGKLTPEHVAEGGKLAPEHTAEGTPASSPPPYRTSLMAQCHWKSPLTLRAYLPAMWRWWFILRHYTNITNYELIKNCRLFFFSWISWIQSYHNSRLIQNNKQNQAAHYSGTENSGHIISPF